MNLLKCLTAVVLAATTVAAAPQIADACGGYGNVVDAAPTIHLVSSHRTPSGPRAFVALGASEQTEQDGTWTRLWPQSFDYTSVKEDGDVRRRLFTLVGPSGWRIVGGSKRVLVSGTFTLGLATQETIEVPTKAGDDFVIAIEGRARDVKWVELEEIGFDALPRFAAKPQFELRRGDTLLGTYDGRALGAIEVSGRTYMIVKHDATASVHAIL